MRPDQTVMRIHDGLIYTIKSPTSILLLGEINLRYGTCHLQVIMHIEVTTLLFEPLKVYTLKGVHFQYTSVIHLLHCTRHLYVTTHLGKFFSSLYC